MSTEQEKKTSFDELVEWMRKEVGHNKDFSHTKQLLETAWGMCSYAYEIGKSEAK